MSPEEEALLRAIHAEPEDDTVRLAYADWSDENAPWMRDRAAFIRVQIELSKNSVCPFVRYEQQYSQDMVGKVYIVPPPTVPEKPCGWCPVCTNKAKEKALLRHRIGEYMTNEASWVIDFQTAVFTTPYPGGNEERVFRWEWARGFVDELTLSPRDWLNHWYKLTWHPQAIWNCQDCRGYGQLYGPQHCESCDGRGLESPAFSAKTAHPLRKVVLTEAPAVHQLTTRDLAAPEGWSAGFGLGNGRRRWRWESLGKPDIDPADHAALAKVVLKAEWSWIEFDILNPENTD